MPSIETEGISSAQRENELEAQKQLLQLVNKKTKEFKKRCKALQAELDTARAIRVALNLLFLHPVFGCISCPCSYPILSSVARHLLWQFFSKN